MNEKNKIIGDFFKLNSLGKKSFPRQENIMVFSTLFRQGEID
jgi:hypothetical protein